RIAQRVAYWSERADCIITGLMGVDGFGRWDVIIPSQLFLDTGLWSASQRESRADGKNGAVVVAHAPNHRGFKGTEFVLAAVETLKAEGLKVELRLIEGLQNDEVRRILREEVDILVEQLIYTGYALNALE